MNENQTPPIQSNYEGIADDSLEDDDTIDDLDGISDGDRQLTTESDAIDGGLNDSDLGDPDELAGGGSEPL